MKFGIDYFPDAHPDRVSGRQYFAEVLDLAEYADALGYARFYPSFQINFGMMNQAKVRRSIELFAKHVMPRFR
jgi:hypothetical protein